MVCDRQTHAVVSLLKKERPEALALRCHTPTQVTRKEIPTAGWLETRANGLNEPMPSDWLKVVEQQQTILNILTILKRQHSCTFVQASAVTSLFLRLA